MITLTKIAANKVSALLETRPDKLGLRVGVRGGGCSGFTYFLEFAEEITDRDRELESHGIKLIVDSGASVTSTPVAELQTHGVEPIINKVSNFGGKPSIGSDLEIYSGAGMLDILRSSLRSQRIFSNMKFYEQGMKGEKKSISTREALEWTTINNAIALGMDDRIGSLKPGKKADIILIDGESLNMSSAHNPEQATVMHANESDIRFVLINGKVVKENGKLLLSEEKINKWKEELKESKKNLMQRSNFNS